MVVRLLVTYGIDMVVVGVSAAMYYGMARVADGGNFDAFAFWVPLSFVAVLSVGMATAAAISPARCLRAVIRAQASFPTCSPGYGVWHGDKWRENRR